jgi:hypothetical protein
MRGRDSGNLFSLPEPGRRKGKFPKVSEHLMIVSGDERWWEEMHICALSERPYMNLDSFLFIVLGQTMPILASEHITLPSAASKYVICIYPLMGLYSVQVSDAYIGGDEEVYIYFF